VPTGASVLVVGAGIIGLAVAKWARFFGAAEVGISEMVPARLERARELGADIVIDAGQHANPVAEYQRRIRSSGWRRRSAGAPSRSG
jgi:(R,R)-butanediol dehydrogenase / meso-butanediol dehydrogenase / diacetyl reductase